MSCGDVEGRKESREELMCREKKEKTWHHERGDDGINHQEIRGEEAICIYIYILSV